MSGMNPAAGMRESAGFFSGRHGRLLGITSLPPAGMAACARGVLVVVGGPQYRVGSHRQFVSLARSLAGAGVPCMRFDYTGMGDAEGELGDFQTAGPDLLAAIDAFVAACPAVREVVLWGLCDGASAAMMHALHDPRVAGLVAVNPWARSDASLAATRVRHYYLRRLLQPDFWLKVLRGGWHWRGSLQSLSGDLARSRSAPGTGTGTFQDAMAEGLRAFRGPTLFVLSGNDLTAKEFLQYTQASPRWRGLLQAPQVTRVDLAEADHTFSQRDWQAALERATLDWLRSLPAPSPLHAGPTHQEQRTP